MTTLSEWSDAVPISPRRMTAPETAIAVPRMNDETPTLALSYRLNAMHRCRGPHTQAFGTLPQGSGAVVATAGGRQLLDLADFPSSEMSCRPVVGDTLAPSDNCHLAAAGLEPTSCTFTDVEEATMSAR